MCVLPSEFLLTAFSFLGKSADYHNFSRLENGTSCRPVLLPFVPLILRLCLHFPGLLCSGCLLTEDFALSCFRPFFLFSLLAGSFFVVFSHPESRWAGHFAFFLVGQFLDFLRQVSRLPPMITFFFRLSFPLKFYCMLVSTTR